MVGVTSKVSLIRSAFTYERHVKAKKPPVSEPFNHALDFIVHFPPRDNQDVLRNVPETVPERILDLGSAQTSPKLKMNNFSAAR